MHHPRSRVQPSVPGTRHRTRVRACAVVLLTLAAATTSSASASPAANVTAADRTFLQAASQGNRFEIASGAVATQITRKAHDTPAKKLAIMAGMIVSDHQKAQQRLATVAKKLDVNISDQPDPVQQFLVSQIASYAATLTTGQASGGQTTTDPNKTNSGDMGSEGGEKGSNGSANVTPGSSTTGTTVATLRGFFLKVQAAVHQQAIQNYSAITISTRNRDVRAYACQSLPVLRRHLAAVQRALGSAQPELAMSGSKALAAKAARACGSPGASG
jgi:predicted outer membrane protein